MIKFDQRNLVAEPARPDHGSWVVAFFDWLKRVLRVMEVGCSYTVIFLGIAMLAIMAGRCAAPVYRYFTVSPAPRSPAPQAIANSQRTVDEADRAPTGQVR